MSSTNKQDDDYINPDATWLEKTKFGQWLMRPCVGSSFSYGFGGYFMTFLASFGWNSHFVRANYHGIAAFTIVTISANTVCTYRRWHELGQEEEVRKKKEEERIQRQEALARKIEERKRLHEEREKAKQNSDGTSA